MQEIYQNLFIGDDNDCSDCTSLDREFIIVHACKTCHKKALNYTKSLPSSHPNYLIYEKDNHLFLNMVDMSTEFQTKFTHPIVKTFLNFIDNHITNKKILIHCNQGVSRSPSLGLLYLAQKGIINNASYKLATSDFLQIYPIYKPGNGFILYLESNWQDIMSGDLI